MKQWRGGRFVRCWSAALLALCAGGVAARAQNEPKLGANLVQNPGFEEGAASWKLPAGTAQVVDDVAHTGARSLYYANTEAARYKLFSQVLNVQPGQILHFSAWVKGKDVAGKEGGQGAGLYLQSYEGDKYLGGAFPGTLTGTFDWKQVTGQYTVLPKATATSVGLYLRKGVTGEVWFDDVEVRVETPAPVRAFLRFPNYRGLVKQGDKAPWQWDLSLSAPPEWKDGRLQIKNTLTDAAGKVLLSAADSVASTAKTALVTLPPAPSLAPGDYRLKLQITDPDGKPALEKERSIRVVTQWPKVYIDAQGFTVVDGKRFFPLGVYLGPTEDEHLERLHQGGFNTILAYGYGYGKDPEAYLKRAAKHDLKVVFSLKDMYPGRKQTANKADPLADAAGLVKLLRDQPNLLAWYINDELPPSWLPLLKQMYEQVVELDADHPTFQVLYQMGVLEQYFRVTDILGVDPYPVGSADLTKTSTNTRIAKAATHGAQGLWIVPQMMDWAVYHADRKPHPPSRDEMRNQAYQAIINGATGLIFYSYYDMFYEKYPRGESTKNMAQFQKRWADAAAMAGEIKALSPAILQGRKVALALPENARVEAGALEYQNELLLLLANPYYQEEQISFTLPAGWKIAQAEQGQIKSSVTGDRATFTLPSVGSGVFRLVRR